MSIYTDKTVDVFYEGDTVKVPLSTGKKGRKILHDPSKHYPNKDEAALLRKIMAETGLNEEEVRSDRHYSELLSDAQKAGQKAKRSEITKWYQSMIKKACRQTKLVPQHPETIKVLDGLLKNANPRWRRTSFIPIHILSADKAVKTYAKK